MKTVTATGRRIERLYHYQSWNHDRLQQQLAANSIYLSNPLGFNDPWDCRPCFDGSRLNDATFYERQVRWFERVDRRHNSHISEDEHKARADKLRNDRAFLEHCISEMAGIDAAIQNRYRIHCLTTKSDNTLMWSHYGVNHTGICLEYRCDNDVLGSAFEVIYCDAYPSLDLADTGIETVLIPLLTKAKDWAYEEEYRLIAQERSVALNHDSLITDNNMLSLPDDALISIIVGCSAAHPMRKAISDIVKNSGRRIELKEARRIPNKYHLSIETLTI